MLAKTMLLVASIGFFVLSSVLTAARPEMMPWYMPILAAAMIGLLAANLIVSIGHEDWY